MLHNQRFLGLGGFGKVFAKLSKRPFMPSCLLGPFKHLFWVHLVVPPFTGLKFVAHRRKRHTAAARLEPGTAWRDARPSHGEAARAEFAALRGSCRDSLVMDALRVTCIGVP